MRIVVSFLSLFLPLYLLAQNGQARQPNVMVVPFVEPGEGENDRIKDAVLNDEAVPLALSKIKEEFNLRNFKTIDFMTEFQRVQNRAYAASALNAKSTGLQAYVDGARADIYVTVKISKEDFAGGASNVTLLMEAKERETGFSLANASIVSDRFRASKKELTEYALEGISENFFNQLNKKSVAGLQVCFVGYSFDVFRSMGIDRIPVLQSLATVAYDLSIVRINVIIILDIVFVVGW